MFNIHVCVCSTPSNSGSSSLSGILICTHSATHTRFKSFAFHSQKIENGTKSISISIRYNFEHFELGAREMKHSIIIIYYYRWRSIQTHRVQSTKRQKLISDNFDKTKFSNDGYLTRVCTCVDWTLTHYYALCMLNAKSFSSKKKKKNTQKIMARHAFIFNNMELLRKNHVIMAHDLFVFHIWNACIYVNELLDNSWFWLLQQHFFHQIEIYRKFVRGKHLWAHMGIMRHGIST